MKRYLQLITLAALVALLFSGILLAQDNEPVYPPFESETLIDNQTTFQPYKGSFSIAIQHRFSQIESISDIYGIYGSANTRIGGDYAVTDKIMVGVGTTRAYMQQDLQWKWSILSQTTNNKVPVSLSYFGNVVLDARDSKYFGTEEEYIASDPSRYDRIHFAFPFVARLSYLNQLIVSRKFGEKVGIQMAPTFVYYNAVTEGYRNDNYSLNFGGRFQVMGLSSIILEYDQPLAQPTGDNAKTIYPNMALALRSEQAPTLSGYLSPTTMPL